ncbi:MAG: alginate O-acetyltransferase AlgX-related protein [Nannocystales bacterium]
MARFEYGITIGFWALLATPLVLDVAAFDTELSLPGMRPTTEVPAIEPDDWLDGVATARGEQLMVGGSVIARWVVPHYNAAWYRWTGRTAPAARVDDDGWIFISSRARPLPPHRYDELLDTVPAMVRAQVDAIEARGPRVVIAVVPERARLHPEHAYPQGLIPPGKEAYLSRLVDAMREQGLTVVELEPALRRLQRSGGEPFYRADHHWTSRGAQSSADELAHQLRAAGDVPKGCDRPGHEPFEVSWFEQPEVTSLVSKLGFPNKGELERSWDRSYERARFTGPDPTNPRRAPIVYTTTSYGRWGSPQMLSNALACPVVVALRNGNSMTNAASLQGRIERAADIEHTELVVWELLEYDLYSAAGVPLGQDG